MAPWGAPPAAPAAPAATTATWWSRMTATAAGACSHAQKDSSEEATQARRTAARAGDVNSQPIRKVHWLKRMAPATTPQGRARGRSQRA